MTAEDRAEMGALILKMVERGGSVSGGELFVVSLPERKAVYAMSCDPGACLELLRSVLAVQYCSPPPCSAQRVAVQGTGATCEM